MHVNTNVYMSFKVLYTTWLFSIYTLLINLYLFPCHSALTSCVDLVGGGGGGRENENLWNPHNKVTENMHRTPSPGNNNYGSAHELSGSIV